LAGVVQAFDLAMSEFDHQCCGDVPVRNAVDEVFDDLTLRPVLADLPGCLFERVTVDLE
jgi:hypothetical protein